MSGIGGQLFAVTFLDCSGYLMLKMSIHKLFSSPNNVGNWNFTSRRSLNDRETDDFSSLLDCLGDFALNLLRMTKDYCF